MKFESRLKFDEVTASLEELFETQCRLLFLQNCDASNMTPLTVHYLQNKKLSYRRNSWVVTYKTHIAKTGLSYMGYIFAADTDCMCLASVNLTQLTPKAAVLRDITPNDGH